VEAYFRAKPTIALAPKHKTKSGPTWGALKTCPRTKHTNNVTNGAINQVNSYIPPAAQGAVSVGSGGTSGVNVNNGAANNLLSPTINGAAGAANQAGSSLTHVFGN
jgi:hypothetical protein